MKIFGLFVAACSLALALAEPARNERPPENAADLRFWLENMIAHHRFSAEEACAATGLEPQQIAAETRRLKITAAAAEGPREALRVLPYPGGRHPRLGFLDGAIDPQRETKVSVFPPWANGGYVVVDVPEAIFSNLGLTYLAHTHIPTIWTARGITLRPLEWERGADGTLQIERELPNRIAFGAKVQPAANHVRMELWLRNGTAETLTGLRVQNCVMLGFAAGFETQTSSNKVFVAPYAAARSSSGARWVITAWVPNQRCWGNAPCPCLHSDPQFPDCAPGKTQSVRGWLSFYQGTDIHAELARIESTGWQAGATREPSQSASEP